MTSCINSNERIIKHKVGQLNLVEDLGNYPGLKGDGPVPDILPRPNIRKGPIRAPMTNEQNRCFHLTQWGALRVAVLTLEALRRSRQGDDLVPCLALVFDTPPHQWKSVTLQIRGLAKGSSDVRVPDVKFQKITRRPRGGFT